MYLRRRQFGVLAAATVAMPWVARAQSTHLTALYEAAKKEGELTWYTVPQTSEVVERMGRTFTTRYPGVKVNVVRTTAQVAFQRLNRLASDGAPKSMAGTGDCRSPGAIASVSFCYRITCQTRCRSPNCVRSM